MRREKVRDKSLVEQILERHTDTDTDTDTDEIIRVEYMRDTYYFDNFEEAKYYYLPENYTGEEIADLDDLQEYLETEADGMEFPKIIKNK